VSNGVENQQCPEVAHMDTNQQKSVVHRYGLTKMFPFRKAHIIMGRDRSPLKRMENQPLVF